MIRNMQIRSKLIAVLVVPLVALTVLAAIGIGSNVSRGVQADRVNDQTAFAVSLSTLVHGLQQERDLSAGWVGSGRDAGYALNINAVAGDGDGYPGQAAWARRTWEAMRPHGNGVYVNFLSNEGPGRVREAYPGRTWDRLVEVKRRYDPGNLFRLNQNIPPT